MSARSIELDHDQCYTLMVEMLEELEENIVNSSVELANGGAPYIFSCDMAVEKKQLRKMLKAVQRVKDWYTA